MNFMDLYLDSQKYQDKYESEINMNYDEFYRQYCECSLAIYEANNMIDVYNLKSKHILYAEADGFMQGLKAFLIGAILLLIKIILGVKAMILGAGVALIMWIIKTLGKSSGKTNIPSAGGGGGGSSSVSHAEAKKAEDKTLSARIFAEAKRNKGLKLEDFLKDIDGYEAFSKDINTICRSRSKVSGGTVYWKMSQDPPPVYLEFIQDIVSFGTNIYDSGQFIILYKNHGEFFKNVINKLIEKGTSLRGNSYKDIVAKQPFYDIEFDKDLLPDKDDKTPLYTISDVASDTIINCDSYMAISILTQVLTLDFIKSYNNEPNKNESLKQEGKRLRNEIYTILPSNMQKKIESKTKELLDEVVDSVNSSADIDFKITDNENLETIQDYSNMAKFFSSLKIKPLSNYKLHAGGVVNNYTIHYIDDYKNIEISRIKYFLVDTLEKISKAINEDDATFDITKLKESVNKLTENGKKLKDEFEKIDFNSLNDDLKARQGHLKILQKFSIDVLTILNQSIALGPALINNCNNKVYEELMFDLGIIVYHVVEIEALRIFLESDEVDEF